MSGKRHARDPYDPRRASLRVPIGTPVYIERDTVRGKVRMYGVVDCYPDDRDRELIVRTKTGRNVRISSVLIHTVGAHRT